MPLGDHFADPPKFPASWEELHGFWPSAIAKRLNDILPRDYRSGVKIHLGTGGDGASASREEIRRGAPAWEAASPTLLLETDALTPPEYEVRVYRETYETRLVAAVEIVSPRNKDRPDARDAFASKCHALLQQGVCVVLVDPVTERSANLYAVLADRIGARRHEGRQRVEGWEHALKVGASLPTLPVWISESTYVPLELARTYKESCRGPRIT